MARVRRSSIIVTLTLVATAGSIAAAAAAPLHQHHPAHVDKRVIKVVEVPGPTKIIYELNGENVNQTEVCNGIKAGTLKWAAGTENPPDCPESDESSESAQSATVVSATSSIYAEVSSTTPDSTTSLTTLTQAEILSTTPVASVKSTTSVHAQAASAILIATPIGFIKDAVKASPTFTSQTFSPAPSSSAATDVQTQAPSSTSSMASGGQGLDQEFPDGEIDCMTFPSDYGPINIAWANLGGWSGIQYVTIEGDFVTHIDTAVPGGDGCKPGAMCSYACPPGYQKSQWPSTQGATGQSVGGLSCNSNGKLSLTNPTLSKTLCIQGTGAVIIQNKLSSNAAICRTDYPGTENEVVPLNTEPDSTSPLTCPDASTYYTHQGDPTTAQYYVNNQGVALEDACIWGTDGTDMGNWAPSYFGVGQDIYGKTWCSIASTAQNDPTNYHPLNYTVKITGNTSGNCGLVNGQYCSGDDYTECNTAGCTVELLSGQATYVLEDSSSLSN